MRTLLLAACLSMAAVAVVCGTARADKFLSAMEIFSRLPSTIFEDTPEGLSEDEKNLLIERGECAYWLVASESADRIVFLSRPFGETKVTLQVFRGGEHGFVAALGTSGSPMCALELWAPDNAGGGLVPIGTPPDPPLSDFFPKGYRLPRDASPARLFCLADDGLESRPLFWGSEGLLHIQPAYDVHYVWENGQFIKRLRPAAPIPPIERDAAASTTP